jgi:hypothetical protein
LGPWAGPAYGSWPFYGILFFLSTFLFSTDLFIEKQTKEAKGVWGKGKKTYPKICKFCNVFLNTTYPKNIIILVLCKIIKWKGAL